MGEYAVSALGRFLARACRKLGNMSKLIKPLRTTMTVLPS